MDSKSLVHILIFRGLPGSGKTTFAKEVMRIMPYYLRINKSLLREMLNFGVFSKENEEIINEVKLALIRLIICEKDGYHYVIIDDTNLNPDHIEKIIKIAEDIKITYMLELPVSVTILDFDTKIEDCIKRDKSRDKSVGEEVIRSMHEKYYPLKQYDQKMFEHVYINHKLMSE